MKNDTKTPGKQKIGRVSGLASLGIPDDLGNPP
jgi:hypothetical protein